ncbi:MAG: prepilin-type N-terminal cleavage/methylation domain-containing protein [Smithella sp.]
MQNTLDKIHRRTGFTLVEVLISIFILSVVMSTVYVAYSGTLKVSRQMEEEGNTYKMARITMDRIIRDLSSLQTSGGSYYFTAKKEKIQKREFHSLYFWSAAHLAFGVNEGEGSPATISYTIHEDNSEGSFSLWRADLAAARPSEKKETAEGYIACKNIDSFKLTFYDAEERETDSWDSSSTAGQGEQLPRSVKIELAIVNTNNKEKPYKFMTRIFLPSKKKTP